MPSLRRRRGGTADAAEQLAPPVPWALGDLLRDGPAPLAPRDVAGARLAVALVLAPGVASPRAAGVPAELLEALTAEGIDVRVVPGADVSGAPSGGGPVEGRGASADGPTALGDADVVLAAGWPAAPAVLRAPGVRARAVLATPEPPPLADLGWATGVPLLGPAWMGGALPGGADAAYVPLPVHRRDDLVLVHGDEPLGLLAAAELARRRDDLTFALSGARPDLELPFPHLTVGPGAEAVAHAFGSATVALAPPVRGWRPAAVAMLVCGQAVVAPDDAAGRAALGSAASLARGPLDAADAVEALIADLELRAIRIRAGFARISAGWSATAAALADALRALP